jgi:predicted nucleic acid-binding protein
MSKCNYVIDTSYLDEYYQIDKYSKKQNYPEIKKLFKEAARNESRLYVPVPVIFEIANHIAHVRGSQRYELVERFRKDIEKSCSVHSSPFIIVPCKEFESIQLLINNLIQFSRKYVQQGLGLTDTAVYLQAKQLSEDKKNVFNLPVHIWTKDRSLKALEPDREENPFMGLKE